MKPWMLFVLLTVLSWGCYVPTLHHGQMAFESKNSALRAFLFVGLGYLIMSLAVLAYIRFSRVEPWNFTSTGVSFSTLAGVLGAIGALGIAFALKPMSGGKPIFVAPLVFAGAPIINTFVTMMWSKPVKSPSIWFYAGIVLAGVGAALVLRFKPV